MNDEVNCTQSKAGTQALREFVDRQSRSTTILAALAAVLDAQVTGNSLDPVLQARIDEVLSALGVYDLIEKYNPAQLKHLLAEIRFNMLLETKLLFDTKRTTMWAHTETEILKEAGEVSDGFADTLTRTIVPRLEGLAQRLDFPDGSFLDVGVGVAGLAIAMARLWPSLSVVGIDPWAPSLALARANVHSAGLTGRIQLRQQAAEDLCDTSTFDLAWLPSAFMPEKVMPTACEHVHRALRPGGWLLFAMANPGSDPLSASLVRLRTVIRGGCVIVPGQAETLLNQIGFVDMQTLPSPPGAVVALIAARRMPD
ncbi:SAM-dependent methyltransferase [Gloeobacter violaceus]|uniref:SAM-dependent methyltransferase n=1 Tax=Gloeobacter violaceus TaxID=33072 RepID=UPI0002E67FC8|nr:class I SAM-dependent methyltransferase [Gloeobacter violaceus]